ncbi:MAG: T9SS type A sorting domain-containing protein [Ignavibacteria bacterium]|nr:T9SS type A sorting domain-containing protein [Ignavibacteria bacterium]
MLRFSNVNKDTIWAVGGSSRSPVRGIIYRTTNQGENWFYQIPDSNIIIDVYRFVNFVDKQIGWAINDFVYSGIHTKIGGDSIFTKIKNNNDIVPENFILSQNYPNPFNPRTIINYELRITSYTTLKIYDLMGKEVKTLVNKKQNKGKYEVEFEGSELSSGVYIYSLFIEGIMVNTKKMVLVR